MPAFEVRPERPQHSPFCLEVYIFALSSLEEVINKRPLWVLVEIKKKLAGGPVAPETLTTKQQGAKHQVKRRARAGSFLENYTLTNIMIGGCAGDF